MKCNSRIKFTNETEVAVFISKDDFQTHYCVRFIKSYTGKVMSLNIAF